MPDFIYSVFTAAFVELANNCRKTTRMPIRKLPQRASYPYIPKRFCFVLLRWYLSRNCCNLAVATISVARNLKQ